MLAPSKPWRRKTSFAPPTMLARLTSKRVTAAAAAPEAFARAACRKLYYSVSLSLTPDQGRTAGSTASWERHDDHRHRRRAFAIDRAGPRAPEALHRSRHLRAGDGADLRCRLDLYRAREPGQKSG